MANWFYYDEANRKCGPVNDAQLSALVSRGIIVPETFIETDTGQRGKAKQIPGLKFPPSAGVSPPQFNSVVMDSKPATPVPPVDNKSLPYLLDRYCKRYRFCVLTGFILIAVVFALFLMRLGIGLLNRIPQALDPLVTILVRLAPFVSALCVILGLCLIFFTAYYWCVSLYLAWSVLPEKQARTTPNKAIGYCFIPFFSIYWNFVAIEGLTEDINKSLKEHNITTVRASEGFGTTLSVLLCWSIFPTSTFLRTFSF